MTRDLHKDKLKTSTHLCRFLKVVPSHSQESRQIKNNFMLSHLEFLCPIFRPASQSMRKAEAGVTLRDTEQPAGTEGTVRQRTQSLVKQIQILRFYDSGPVSHRAGN